MNKNEKAPQRVIGVRQFAELAACVLKQLPRDTDPDIAQGWINNPQALGKALRDALCPPFSVLDRVRASGYLDTSFDGREVHQLTIHPLTKEQAFDGYRKSGGVTFVWDELEKNMPYTVPKAEMLDVMILDFDRVIMDTEALAEMDKLGVRPLIYEELIQYGIAHPEHQKQRWLVGIGTKHTLSGNLRAPGLRFYVGGRDLFAIGYGNGWGDSYRFPVVRK